MCLPGSPAARTRIRSAGAPARRRTVSPPPAKLAASRPFYDARWYARAAVSPRGHRPRRVLPPRGPRSGEPRPAAAARDPRPAAAPGCGLPSSTAPPGSASRNSGPAGATRSPFVRPAELMPKRLRNRWRVSRHPSSADVLTSRTCGSSSRFAPCRSAPLPLPGHVRRAVGSDASPAASPPPRTRISRRGDPSTGWGVPLSAPLDGIPSASSCGPLSGRSRLQRPASAGRASSCSSSRSRTNRDHGNTRGLACRQRAPA